MSQSRKNKCGGGWSDEVGGWGRVSQAEGLGDAEVQGCEVGCYGWRSEWST